MRWVLGIDAAWGGTQPSGLALVVEAEGGWELLALSSSVPGFLNTSSNQVWCLDHSVGPVIAHELIHHCYQFLENRYPGMNLDNGLIAVDMPLAKSSVVAAREADRALSRRYGAQGCSVYMPTPEMPGEVGQKLQSGFEALGFRLHTELESGQMANEGQWMCEVYPHPVAMQLMGADYRVPYKCGKSKQYWPALTVPQRIEKLSEIYIALQSALQEQILGVPDVIPNASELNSLSSMKAYEDALDALMCCYAGMAILEGEAEAFGDEDAAIWVPTVC